MIDNKTYMALQTLDPMKETVETMLTFIESVWCEDYGRLIIPKNIYKNRYQYVIFHTGGWSHNEEIIQALRCSMFWTLFWHQERKGGHYWLKVRELI